MTTSLHLHTVDVPKEAIRPSNAGAFAKGHPCSSIPHIRSHAAVNSPLKLASIIDSYPQSNGGGTGLSLSLLSVQLVRCRPSRRSGEIGWQSNGSPCRLPIPQESAEEPPQPEGPFFKHLRPASARDNEDHCVARCELVHGSPPCRRTATGQRRL